MNEKMTNLSNPVLYGEEKKVLCEVINSGWLTMDDRVMEFESVFT